MLPFMIWFSDVREKRKQDKIDKVVEKAYDFYCANRRKIEAFAVLPLLVGLIPIYPVAFFGFGLMLALFVLSHFPDPRKIK